MIQNNTQLIKGYIGRLLCKIASFIERIQPKVMVIMGGLFFIATLAFVRKNTHFIADDFLHFIDSRTKTMWGMLIAPIDVHFVPLHQLASWFIFRFFDLNFDAALTIIALCWGAIVLFSYRLICNLSSRTLGTVVAFLVAVSPLWIHTVIWWSASVHRLPYLLFQIAALFSYLRYREVKGARYAVYCIVAQIFALGFFIKAILLPVLLFAIELCLSVREGRFSRKGLELCGLAAALSALYMAWYFFLAPVNPPDVSVGLFNTFFFAGVYLQRLGSLLLFFPLDQSWSGWLSGFFWLALGAWCVYSRPASIVPILSLLILLFINFVVSLWGRGWLAIFPFGSLRYYVDVVVVIAIFVPLIWTSPKRIRKKEKTNSSNRWLPVLSLGLVIAYPTLSYFSNAHLFPKIYADHKKTHRFMVNAQRSLRGLGKEVDPFVLKANFPSFVSGFAGPIPLESVFTHLYPNIHWVSEGQLEKKIRSLRNDGKTAG